ncbi:MAG: hypothetical protein HY921_11780 [Elusimicrobia bacterium]|nr:hypothetical protein [Elusimicrobiota bacterium]
MARADSLILGAYLLLLLALGARGARRRLPGLSDYVLASRSLTLPAFVATLVPTFYGGVLGIGEFTWQNGLSNWLVMAFPYYLFAGIYALLLAHRVRLKPGLTIPDHLEGAYGKPVAIWAAFLVFLLASPADELLMTGALLSHLSGLGLGAAMALLGCLAFAILLRGGLRSDVAANLAQFAMMFLGFALILPFAFKEIGGPASLAQKLPAGHLSWTGTIGPARLIGWWLIAVWTLVDPAFHQRCAAARDGRTARLGVALSILFWAAFDLMTTAAGLYARAALPDLADPLFAFPALADRLLPPLARGIFLTGLCSSMLAALQATTLIAAVSLGKDGAGRWSGAGEERLELWSKAGLALSLAAAFLMAKLIPSVVELWYSVGSAVIPGLLLPLLGAYFPALRLSAAWALSASVAAWAASSSWVLWGLALGRPPLGLEPMFPGLALSAAIYLIGKRHAPSAPLA